MKDQEVVPILTTIHILLAADDKEDHVIFNEILKTTSFQTKLTAIEDGENLMTYLFENSENLPDVLFLHHNMPCDNGPKCLSEIKLNPKLEKLPVIILSTSLHEDVADMLYDKGAHYYIRKTTPLEFKKVVELIFTQIVEKKFLRPSRDEFILYYGKDKLSSTSIRMLLF